MGLGDFLCQSIEVGFTEKKAIDRSRLWSFTAYGFSVFGPLLYTTYNKILPLIAPGHGWRSVGKKLLFTQTIFTCISMSAFYTVIPILQGEEPSLLELQHKLWPTLLTNWKVWPILQIINFTYVPVALQVAYIAFFSLFFNVYLSYMKNVVQVPSNNSSSLIKAVEFTSEVCIISTEATLARGTLSDTL